ncbi:MAG: hypothetical protein ACKO2G_02550 [Verrucomicrobiales bacterium]
MHISPEIDERSDRDVSETLIGDVWDSEAIIKLIRRNSVRGYMPSLLMLGKKEAALLREHFAEAFGSEGVARLHDLYFAGLKVVETHLDSLVKVAGERMLPKFERASRQLPVWKDESDQKRWRYDAGVA